MREREARTARQNEKLTAQWEKLDKEHKELKYAKPSRNFLLSEVERLTQENEKNREFVDSYSSNLSSLETENRKWQKMYEVQQQQVDASYQM